MSSSDAGFMTITDQYSSSSSLASRGGTCQAIITNNPHKSYYKTAKIHRVPRSSKSSKNTSLVSQANTTQNNSQNNSSQNSHNSHNSQFLNQSVSSAISYKLANKSNISHGSHNQSLIINTKGEVVNTTGGLKKSDSSSSGNSSHSSNGSCNVSANKSLKLDTSIFLQSQCVAPDTPQQIKSLRNISSSGFSSFTSKSPKSHKSQKSIKNLSKNSSISGFQSTSGFSSIASSPSRRKSTTTALFQTWTQHVKDLVTASPIKKSRRNSSIYSRSSNSNNYQANANQANQSFANYPNLSQNSSFLGGTGSTTGAGGNGGSQAFDVKRSKNKTTVPNDIFSRGLLKINIDPKYPSEIRVTLQEITSLANLGCDQCMIEVSLIQARKINSQSNQLSAGNYIIDQFLYSRKTEWLKLVPVPSLKSETSNKGMTTETRKINQTWSIPYLEEANFSSSQSLRLLVSVHVSNSALNVESQPSSDLRHHVGGMSFGVKKILKDSQVRQGWYTLFEPDFAISKHYKPTTGIKPKTNISRVSNNQQHSKVSSTTSLTSLRSNKTLTNLHKASNLQTIVQEPTEENAQYGSNFPQTQVSIKITKLRRSWCGFGVQICPVTNNLICKSNSVAVRAGITENDKIIGVLEMGIESSGTEILKFLNGSVLEYVSVKILKNGMSLHDSRPTGAASGLSAISGLQLSESKESKNCSPRRFSLRLGSTEFPTPPTSYLPPSGQMSTSITSLPNSKVNLSQLSESLEGNQIGLVGIDTSLIFADHVKSVKILSKKRKFVYSSEISVNGGKNLNGGSYWAILLSDLFIISQPSGNKYLVVENPFKMRYVSLVKEADDGVSFSFVYAKTDQTYHFTLPTPELAEMWKKLIRRYQIGEDEIINNDMGFDVYMGPSNQSTLESQSNKSHMISSSVTSSSASSQESSLKKAQIKSSQIKSIKEWGRRKSANFTHLAQPNNKFPNKSSKIDEAAVITSLPSNEHVISHQSSSKNTIPCGTDFNQLPGSYVKLNKDNENNTHLEILLKDAKFFNLFNAFLKGEYSEENLEFWSEVEQLKQEIRETVQNTRVNEIWDKFIQAGSEREVNLDDCTRKGVQEKLKKFQESGTLANISVLLPAQEKIYNLMVRDSYPRFQKTLKR